MNQTPRIRRRYGIWLQIMAVAGTLAGWFAVPGAHVAAAQTPPVAAQQATAEQQAGASPRTQTTPAAQTRTPPRAQLVRTLTLIGSALTLLALAAVLLPGRLRWLIVGEDNRYSTSKFQMLLWSWCVLTVYLATTVLRWVDVGIGANDGIAIPTTLLALAGMSTLTFAGAKLITTSRIERSGEEGAKTAPLTGPRFPRDLVNDDSGHRPDIGDTQMLLITVVAVAMYLAVANHWLGTFPATGPITLPEIDGTLLGALGIGQGAYLAKKYAGDAPPAATGPVLTAPLARPVRPVR